MDIDLDALEARAKAATPGPYTIFADQRVAYSLMPSGRDGDVCTFKDCVNPDGDAEFFRIADPQTVLALVARAREADRLEEERDARPTMDIVRAWQANNHAAQAEFEKRWRNAEKRELAAETEVAHLRTVVEKLEQHVIWLRTCVEAALPFLIGRPMTQSMCRRRLAETAPDVPADQDGRAG